MSNPYCLTAAAVQTQGVIEDYHLALLFVIS